VATRSRYQCTATRTNQNAVNFCFRFSADHLCLTETASSQRPAGHFSRTKQARFTRSHASLTHVQNSLQNIINAYLPCSICLRAAILAAACFKLTAHEERVVRWVKVMKRAKQTKVAYCAELGPKNCFKTSR